MEPSPAPTRTLPPMVFTTDSSQSSLQQTPGYGLQTPASSLANRTRIRQDPRTAYRPPNPIIQPEDTAPPSNSLFLDPTASVAAEFRTETGMPAPAETMQSDESSRHLWVTVFGFPPVMTEVVLQYFHSCGEIIRVRHAPEQGNWVHLMFQTRLQAEKALGKSGKIIQGNLMVGVTQCTDESAFSEKSKEKAAAAFKPHNEKPFIPSSSDFSVDPSLNGANPRAERGFWSKLSEYIIGV